MILNWMAYAALCAALFGLAAASVDSLFAGRRRARRGVWIAAIAASILVPIALPFLSLIGKTPVASTPVTAVQETSGDGRSASINVDLIVLGIWGVASSIFAVSTSRRSSANYACTQTLPHRNDRRARRIRLAGFRPGRGRSAPSSHRRAGVDARPR